MRTLCIVLMCFFCNFLYAQDSYCVLNACINSPTTLSKIKDGPNDVLVDGKVAYEGVGSVAGVSGVAISLFWIGGTDNVWVLAFDGQPYFFNNNNGAVPPTSILAGFTWEAVSGQDCVGTLPLEIFNTACSVVPVTLSSFKGRTVNNLTELVWTTAAETNNKGFEVEHSVNGKQWETIGFVEGKGTTTLPANYTFSHNNPATGINYYRLLQIDFDGKKKYSNVVTVVQVSSNEVTVLNNPGSGIFRINVPPGMSNATIVVFDAGGKTLITQRAVSGINVVNLSKYAGGVYPISILKNNSRVFQSRLIKTN